MSPSNWREVKSKARAADPTWDNSERVERRAEMLASVSGAQLAEIRRQLGVTQTQLAEATGLTQARISQIENAGAMGLDTLRVARIGNIQLNIA
ncbi:XRE family transcriptional regulator [Frankia sp. R43]|uniref:helix-turn-helix domain-containing protein n=1 Tax=Frankia sp. R43 TaxID=269536 RepID=UPI0006CA5EA2|nr:helix-turn-helix transcriptional regulator [Frankia sp. R43]KPM55964.1 XRE family transcriptional regulator [Frankia sp. R43]